MSKNDWASDFVRKIFKKTHHQYRLHRISEIKVNDDKEYLVATYFKENDISDGPFEIYEKVDSKKSKKVISELKNKLGVNPKTDRAVISELERRIK